MTRDERHNEIQKARSTFLNALSIGAIIAGGLNALTDGQWPVAMFFFVLGVGLHYLAISTLQRKRITDD